MAGIKAELPIAAYAWLQFWRSPDDEVTEPYICISLMNQEPATEVGLNEAMSLPRIKSEQESIEGTLNYDLIRSWINPMRLKAQ